MKIQLKQALTGLCLSALLLSAAPAYANETEDAGFTLTGIAAETGVNITRTILLDYPGGTASETVRAENTSDADAKVTLVVPTISSLLSEHGTDLTVQVLAGDGLSDAEIATETFFSPVFSSSDLSATNVSTEALLACRERSSEVPETPGVYLDVTRTKDTDSGVFLTLSELSEDCHIYPLYASYSGIVGGYEFSIAEGETSCGVFLTGKSGSDFTAEPVQENAFSITESDMTLKDFLQKCCKAYVETLADPGDVTEELLMTSLADYFGRSSVTVSLDLLPTLALIAGQSLYQIDTYRFAVPAGGTVEVELSSKKALAAGGVALETQLITDSADTARFLKVVFPEGYSSAVLRGTTNNKTESDENSTVYEIKEFKDNPVTVVLFLIPIWQRTMNYLPVFLIIMAVFMVLCFVSYRSRGKNTPKKDDAKKA